MPCPSGFQIHCSSRKSQSRPPPPRLQPSQAHPGAASDWQRPLTNSPSSCAGQSAVRVGSPQPVLATASQPPSSPTTPPAIEAGECQVLTASRQADRITDAKAPGLRDFRIDAEIGARPRPLEYCRDRHVALRRARIDIGRLAPHRAVRSNTSSSTSRSTRRLPTQSRSLNAASPSTWTLARNRNGVRMV